MAITFPANPSLNDTFTSGGKTFQWNGTSWTVNQEANILADTTPQLGGNLDLNSRDITGTGDINVTGTVTATSFSGDGSSLTGAGTTTTAEWTLGADGSNHYTFTGPGVTAGATDPTIYLTRGQTYKFKNRSGGHPFRIQTSFQNTGGTAYNDGITNNAAGNGEDLYWEVRNDTPDVLYYQCTSHTNMSGRINMIGGESKVVGLTSTTATARDAGITTATGSIVYIPDVGLQVYTGNEAGWKTIADTDANQNLITATGGSVTTIGGYKVHTFTSSGTFVISEGEGDVQYLVVAGGGAGSKAHTTNTCGGGGAGGGADASNGRPGGSGAGGGRDPSSGGTGSQYGPTSPLNPGPAPGQGNPGGTGSPGDNGAAGDGGDGGAQKINSYSGKARAFGGGGGSNDGTNPTAAGVGGSVDGQNGVNGQTNTGRGGYGGGPTASRGDRGLAQGQNGGAGGGGAFGGGGGCRGHLGSPNCGGGGGGGLCYIIYGLNAPSGY